MKQDENPAPQRDRFHYFERLRVRWAEVDVMGIVFNAHYVTYVDVALTGYWRSLGMPLDERSMQVLGDMYMRKLTMEYSAPAGVEDVLDIGVRCARLGNSSITFEIALFKGEQLLVLAHPVYVFADPQTRRPRTIGAAVRAIIEAREAGRPVLELKTGPWAELKESAAAVRSAVFVAEQGIAQEEEWDDADVRATHVVAFNGLGWPVATGRLLLAPDGSARIGRMAVERLLRGAGLGARVLDALESAARQAGATRVQLHAQQTAAGFYARRGYQAQGEPFDEVGIAHLRMSKELREHKGN